MSGETEQQQSGWTVDTLNAHMSEVLTLLRQQIDRQWADERRATDIALKAHDEALKVAATTSEKAVTAALAAQKEAVGIAQTFADQRAASMNEWRQSLDDVLTKAMPRQEAESAIQRATERVHELNLALQSVVQRPEHDAAMQRMGERLGELDAWRSRIEGTGLGKKENQAGIYAAIGGAVAIIGVMVLLANAFLR